MTWIGSEAWIKSVSQNTGLAVGYFGVLPDVKYSMKITSQNYLWTQTRGMFGSQSLLKL